MKPSATDVLRTVLDEESDEVLVINPRADTVEELVSVMKKRDGGPTVRLLAEERPLKDVMGDFIVASTAADLVADERLSLRVLEEPPGNSLLVTDERVIAMVFAGEQVGGLAAEDERFVENAFNHYTEAWEEAEEFSLRTPPLTRVRETLASDIDQAVADDFDSVLNSLQTARGNGDGLDEVTISLLVAAKNGELLYDISKWGEDVGLASKATFSRTKTTLEDMGLIDTEKVPIDVGRPRLRLMLGDDRLREANTDELASVAQSLLAS